MKANHLVTDDGSKRQPIEDVIDFLEDGVRFLRVLTKTTGAFISKAEALIDPSIFVIASAQVNFLRELNF